MSLETAVSKALFQGNGAAVDFPFAFRVWDARELTVLVTGPDGGVRDVTARCGVSLSESGGAVHYAPDGKALPAGHTLVILRNMPFVQDIRLISGTRFDPAVIEEALDRATAERQQLLEKVGRAVLMPPDSVEAPETLASRLFAARDGAQLSADRARDEADRAERAAQAVVVARGVSNLEAVWRLDAPVRAGDALELPVGYFPGRNVLHLGCDGVELYRGPQYRELDAGGSGGAEALSFAVRMRVELPAGSVMRAWVAASNVARQVEEAEQRARAAADRAETARNVAQNAALEATEQAGRADDAAVDAARLAHEVEKAGLEAREAFRCATLLSRGRGLSSLRSFARLGDTPSGFFIVNPGIVVPATAHQPLTPVKNAGAIPGLDGFFLFAPPFPDCAANKDEKPQTPEAPAAPAWFMPCGKRVRNPIFNTGVKA